ncbi:unnamed protein product [Haemonchus placei]|uniref:Uncharacterized protein n=1 Tax=Haemonchus placei TaxID=6290 RepID=A0A0N4WB44_HAEPC|nr:unnamed protein product [Haemonchus placei]
MLRYTLAVVYCFIVLVQPQQSEDQREREREREIARSKGQYNSVDDIPEFYKYTTFAVFVSNNFQPVLERYTSEL